MKWGKVKNAKKYQVYVKTGSGKYKLKKTLKGTSVSYLRMDVRDISYEIDYAIDDSKYASESLECLLVIGEDKGTSATRECISMIPDIEVGDRILVRTDTGKEKKKVVKSVCKVKGSDLKRSLDDYDSLDEYIKMQVVSYFTPK